jgi:wyosine [tRNA(Phe)-imidazoG37] synthetase (radical SAM superfamily)
MSKFPLRSSKGCPVGRSARLQGYNYFHILKDFLGGDLSRVFSGELVYPRQLEIHLPGDHKQACNFKCYYCQGDLVEQPLNLDEKKVLKLINDIGGDKFEYYIFGGAYAEPLLNPYLLDFIYTAKRHKVNIGIHTNGSLLKQLEEKEYFLTKIFRTMETKDYISISLDAATPTSHMKTKNLHKNFFDDIIDGIRIMSDLQKSNPNHPAVRICYLLNEFNSSENEIANIVTIAKQLQVDSLRFSIPYDQYGKPFEEVRKYKNTIEVAEDYIYKKRLEKYISKSLNKKPYIFYFPPIYQDVDLMNYKHCIYTYYQITIASDGNVYRCSSIASPSFSYGILGPLPDSKQQFEKLILKAQAPDFDCNKCFNADARCNRMALEINSKFNASRYEIARGL